MINLVCADVGMRAGTPLGQEGTGYAQGTQQRAWPCSVGQ
jgi:hypothetical protein